MAIQPTVSVDAHGLNPEQLHHMYSTMVLMRQLHDRATTLQRQGRIHSWLGCLGQEGAIVGSAMAMAREDWIFPSYREHAVAFLRGVPLKDVFNHLFANRDDTAKGRNLPPEYSFREVNFVSVSAPVGTQIPQAVGAAYAAKLKGDAMVAITYFGEGTSSTGEAHAGMNFAGVFKAPVIFFCQNNGWAISVPVSKQTAAARISDRALGYGFEGVQVDGNDPLAVYAITKAAADKARAGGGPTLIEALTYRVGPHSTSDDPSGYRNEEEVLPWRARDPLSIFEAQLAALGLWDPAFGARVAEEAKEALLVAAREAMAVPGPDLDSMFEEVYDQAPWHIEEQRQALKALRGR